MPVLSDNDIKAELSYAYLHAVASRAGFICEMASRLSDAAGVDAVLRVRERLAPDSVLTHFTVDVQLKATSEQPALNNGKYSFSLDVRHYHKLRVSERAAPLLLVVLFLPDDRGQWLVHSEEELIARRCAYWMTLRGAPPSQNTETQTVYIPKTNCLSAEALRSVMARVSRGVQLNYEL